MRISFEKQFQRHSCSFIPPIIKRMKLRKYNPHQTSSLGCLFHNSNVAGILVVSIV